MKRRFLTLFTTLILPVIGQASIFDMDGLHAWGSGCPEGSVLILPSQELGHFEIHIQSFRVDLFPGRGRTVERKVCQMSIPILLPSGLRIGFKGWSFNGHIDMNPDSRGQITMRTHFETGLTETKEIIKSVDFYGPVNKDYRVTGYKDGGWAWSSCGGTVLFKTSFSASVVSNYRDAPSLMGINVESRDTAAEFQVESCR